MILARKTVISKWSRAKDECENINNENIQWNIEKINADVITSELRTTSNALSTWAISENIEDVESNIKEVVLALLTGKKVSSIETIDLILIDTKTASKFKFDDTEEGDTSIDSLKNRHYNICDLNYKQLGELSKYFMGQIKNEKFIKITKSKVQKILKEAFKEKIVKIDDFSEALQEKVKKIVGDNRE